ncbi:MAG: GNAT family N-acetyltransferase [Chloroflexia bacterium]|nr:GNAT family N-acetyltransferase [Chloroflexia bacterium]
MEAGRFVTESLRRDHDRSGFASGQPDLDRYLWEVASQDVRRRATAAFVLVDTQAGIVAGYYTLSATSLASHELPEAVLRRLPRYPVLPAILLGRLALDSGYQGRQLGGVLLYDALQRALRISAEIGAIGVVVDAIDERALTFYERHAFVQLGESRRRLFQTMASIEALVTED